MHYEAKKKQELFYFFKWVFYKEEKKTSDTTMKQEPLGKVMVEKKNWLQRVLQFICWIVALWSGRMCSFLWC